MIQQLNAQDAQFLFAQSGSTLTHVMGVNIYDPATAPGGKVRLRELLHSKAIMGRQQLVCAPSCLGAERRANAR